MLFCETKHWVQIVIKVGRRPVPTTAQAQPNTLAVDFETLNPPFRKSQRFELRYIFN